MEDTERFGMGTPELLLQSLNAALRELRSAVTLLEDADGLNAQMLPVVRRLLLAEVLGKASIIAIGGSQGAGKTTLLNALYALKGEDARWLQPNEGQGECMPVLVLEEHGRTQVQGAVRRLVAEGASFRVREVLLEKEGFQKVVRNPEPSDLLPVFKVPSRYFQRRDQAWLLLPGYESETRQNKEWQRLMRQALVGAAGCIIVTDETRMANQEQVDIVKDMMNKELRGAQALVAISKTEGARGQPDRLQALRARALQLFFDKSPERAVRRVICTGVDDEDYVAEWLPDLSTLLEDLALSGGGSRHAQLKQLEAVLDQDLAALLARIRTKADLWLGQQEDGVGGALEVMRTCLEAFDVEQNELRADYLSAVGRMLDKQYGAAWKQLEGRLAEDHEGLGNHLKDFFRTASESHKRIEQAVADAWQSPGPVLNGYAQAVWELTSKKLEAHELPALRAAAQTPGLSKDSLAQRLGYVNGQELRQWGRPDEDDQHHLRLLFVKTKQPDEKGSAGHEGKRDERVRVGFERSVKLLPALGLEFARVASVMPEVVGVEEGTTLNPVDLPQRPDLIRSAMQNLGDGVNLGRTVLRGIAAVLAFDVVADGELDVPSVLSSVLGGGAAKAAAGGSAAAGAVTGVGAAVVGLVAVGYLTYSAMKESRQHGEKAIVMFQMLLRNIRDQHHEHFMRHFDDLMNKLRTRLKLALRERYHLDQALMEKDRLAKALADVRMLRRDLLDELGRSGLATPALLTATEV